MRLCNFFLAAAVFLLVGISRPVAGEPADEDTLRETTYSLNDTVAVKGNNSFAQYFNDAKNDSLTIILPKYKGTTETKSLWALYTPGYHNTDTKTSFDGSTDPADAQASHPADNGISQVYEFSVSFDNSISEDIGRTGQSDDDSLDFLGVVAAGTDDRQLSDNGSSSILVFRKTTPRNSQNRARILSGGSYLNEFEKEEDFNSPLTTPIALLLLMFGFCIILVIYTSAGEKMKE